MELMFSVIIPIYNVEKYLEKCVDSVLNQTYDNFEVILVDDGSPDNCPLICDNYSREDTRVRVLHKKNGGLVSARNAGVLSARGKYVCYVDGDDWVSENLLTTVIQKAINPHKPDMIIFGAKKIFDERSERIENGIPEGLYNKDKLKEDVYPYMMYDPRKPFCMGLVFPVAWNKIYKRELLLRHYCKDERIRMGEDNAFVFESIYNSKSIYFCDDELYFYNKLNEGSMTNTYDPNRFENNVWLTTYIEKQMKSSDNVVNNQINAFKAYWLIMAIFHEMKCGRSLKESTRHIKKELKKTKVLDGIRLSGLPIMARGYLMLVKCRLYSLTMVATKVLVWLRQ